MSTIRNKDCIAIKYVYSGNMNIIQFYMKFPNHPRYNIFNFTENAWFQGVVYHELLCVTV